MEPWTTTFNPGSHLDRLVELSQEVDFAAFVFAQDDWTTTDASQSWARRRHATTWCSRLVFGGALGMRRTFILHAEGSKLPSDLFGLTSVALRPGDQPGRGSRDQPEAPQGDRDPEGSRGLVEGWWWQLSLTMRSEEEPSAVSLLRISRDATVA